MSLCFSFLFVFFISILVCYYCLLVFLLFFFFKQNTTYDMRISDWSSDVCSSDLENVIVCDRSGPIYPGRDDVDQWKSAHAVATEARTLEDALVGADIFLGLSAAGALKPEWIAKMAAKPIIFAMANPTPETIATASRSERLCQNVYTSEEAG